MVSSTTASSRNSGAQPRIPPHKIDYVIVVLLYFSLVRGDSDLGLFSSYLDNSA